MSFLMRKSLRLNGYNYYRPGYYFVTICTFNRAHLLGKIIDQEMILNCAGKMVGSVWQSLSTRYPNVILDEFIVMPDHIHAIIKLSQDFSETTTPASNSLSDIIRNMKSYTTAYYIREVKKHNYPKFNGHLWQRGYYEHIIRNITELNIVRQYIINNPKKWHARY